MSLSEVVEMARGGHPAFPASYSAVAPLGCGDCVTSARFHAAGSTHPRPGYRRDVANLPSHAPPDQWTPSVCP